MAERLLQPPKDVTAAARHLARVADEQIDRDRLAWIGAGRHVGRSTLLALLASGVDGRVGAWATRTYAGMLDQERDLQALAFTAAAVADDGRYFGILAPGMDMITAVVRASADGLARWTSDGWVDVPADRAPVGLPYRELAGDLLADAVTAAAAGQALLLRPTVPRGFLSRKVPLTASAGGLDGVYAAVDEADTTAVLDLVKVDGAHHYRRSGGAWCYDEDATLPYLVASGAPLALVPEQDLPGLLRAFDDHEAVFPPLIADAAGPGPSVAGLAVRAADTGRVLMLQRANTEGDPAAGDWEFPGGHLEDGEDPLTGACREWCEETGMSLPDDAEHADSWTSPDGVYQGHVLTVPGEDTLDLHNDRGDVTNPDDPDGDQIESIAWWEPADLVDNPAVRAELLRDLPVVMPALTGPENMPANMPAETVTAAYRYRHGWIPIGGDLNPKHRPSQHSFRNPREKAEYQGLSWRGRGMYDTQRAMGSGHRSAHRAALAAHGPANPREEAAHAARVQAAHQRRLREAVNPKGLPTPREAERARSTIPGDVHGEHSSEQQIVQAAAGLHDRAVKAEPGLTRDVRGIVEGLGGRMEGIDRRLKTRESLQRKIAADVKDTGNTPDQVASKIFDTNRYTGVFPAGSYSTESKAVLDRLRAEGYTLRVKNFWTNENNPYQGVNVQVTSPDGTQWELQLHTDQSLGAKGPAHKVYERQRVLPPNDPRQAALTAQARSIFGGVPIPPGVRLIS